MLVNLSDVLSEQHKTIDKFVPIEMESYRYGLGVAPVIDKSEVHIVVKHVKKRELTITGEAKLAFEIPCDRCLTEVPVNFEIEISKEINLEKLLAEDIEELEDTNYMLGTNLDVDKLIFGEILVSWPMKVLCSEDCKGICKRCGINLNLAECQCQKTEPDPRMAAIQDIFNQFKEV